MDRKIRKNLEKTCYEMYRLEWMLSHGVTLKDFIERMAMADDEMRNSERDYPEGGCFNIYDQIANEAEEYEFNNGMNYVCMDEFLGAEMNDKEYMIYLLEHSPKKELISQYLEYKAHMDEVSRYVPTLGPNSNQWWIYDDKENVFIDPPAKVLSMVEAYDDIDDQETELWKILEELPNWLHDKEYTYDADTLDI